MFHLKQLAYDEVSIVHERCQLRTFTSQLFHNSCSVYYVSMRNEREQFVNIARPERPISFAQHNILCVFIPQRLLQATVYAPAISRRFLCDHNGSALSGHLGCSIAAVVFHDDHPLDSWILTEICYRLAYTGFVVVGCQNHRGFRGQVRRDFKTAWRPPLHWKQDNQVSSDQQHRQGGWRPAVPQNGCVPLPELLIVKE